MADVLDAIDRRILFELDCNARQPLSQIARKVRLGRDLVTYRIERLKELGLLKKCTVMVNPYKLGFTVYKTYLKLEASKARVAKLVETLEKDQRIMWLAECYGKWDLMYTVLANTPKEIYDLHDKWFSEFNDLILGTNICTLVDYWWYPKKYLISSPATTLGQQSEEVRQWSFATTQFTFGTTPDQYHLDVLEYGILQLLSDDAQMSFSEIALKLNSTPAIVKYRIEKLEQLGVIAGYRVELCQRRLGRNLFRVQVHLGDLSLKRELEFQKYCREHPSITSYIRQIGECKIEFEIEVRDHEEFNTVIDQIRERFSRYVRSMDFMVVRKDYGHRCPCTILHEAPEQKVVNF